MTTCPNCGKQIEEESKFCPDCGTNFESNTPATNPGTNVTQTTAPAQPQNVSPKSRLAALLLGIFLGELGIHNLYLGKIAKGIIQMAMYIVGFGLIMYYCFHITVNAALAATNIESYATNVIFSMPLMLIGILLISAVGIWAMVEWIIIACGKGKDKNGLPVLVWTK